MKVILLQDIKGQGKKGDIKEFQRICQKLSAALKTCGGSDAGQAEHP